jgi:hypothetical protein
MALKDMLEQAREQMVKQAGGAMDSLAAIAASLEMKETAARIKKNGERLKSENFNLIVIGRFKNGKSTMMNSLLGKPTVPVVEMEGDMGPMPVDDLPCTATLTSIRYAEKPYVRVWRFDGKSEDWSLTKYLRESSVRGNEEENEKVFKDIRGFDVGFPAELCKSGVTLMDSPGLDDVPQRTEVTRQAVDQCDAAIVIYRSDVCAGQGEREFVSGVLATTGTRVFTLINMWGGRKVDDRFKAFAWNRLVAYDQGGQEYSGQDFGSKDIYFVDGLKALQGKLTDNAQLVADSGLALFEQRLGDFLLKERHYTHMQKFIRSADVEATAIEQQVSQRRAAIEADGQKLAQAYEAIQPQFEAIRARRDKLPLIFARYKKEAERDLRAGFEQMIAQLRNDLPAELKAKSLPTMAAPTARLTGTFQQKKLCAEALEACNEIINDRVMAWGKPQGGPNGAAAILGGIMERMLEEVRVEIAAIDRAFGQAHFELTGWSVNAIAPTSVVSTQERVLSGVAGLLVGDFSVVTGGAGGWRSVAGALGANIVTGIVLTTLGLAGSIVFWPIVIVGGILASLVTGSMGLEDRVKAKVLETVLPGLANAPQEAGALLEGQLSSVFGQVEQETMTSILAVIEEEERNIHRMSDLNKRSQADKAQALAMLDDLVRKVTAIRQGLKEITVKAQQAA